MAGNVVTTKECAILDLMDCKQCSRLSQFLESVKAKHPDYHARPVSAFGDINPKLLIVGLAPGMHGANRTGRPFTGDYAGILLYQTLHKFGFATRHESVSADDGLQLTGCRITNAVNACRRKTNPFLRKLSNVITISQQK